MAEATTTTKPAAGGVGEFRGLPASAATQGGVSGGIPPSSKEPSPGGSGSRTTGSTGNGDPAGGANRAGQVSSAPAVQAPSTVPGSQRAPVRTAVAGRRPFSFKVGTTHDADPWMRFLVYGPYGAGKTRLIGSCVLVPEMQDF